MKNAEPVGYVIKFLSLAAGGEHHANGTYLRYYSPARRSGAEEYDGGCLVTTREISRAERFAMPAEAWKKWMTQAPPPDAIRPDGRLNRPLTAFNIGVVPIYERDLEEETQNDHREN